MNRILSSLIIAGSLIISAPTIAQKEKDQFTSLIPIQSVVDFGEWDGADVTGGSIIPIATEGFCIVYTKKQDNTLHQVDYGLSMSGPVNGGSFTISNGLSNLPVSFTVNKAAANISTGAAPINPWTPGYTYNVTFPNPAASNSDIHSGMHLFPNGCDDAKYFLEISISSADIVALANPTGVFTGSFSLVVDPVFNSGNLQVDNLYFDVQITISSSVYISQLAASIDLGATSTEDFCIWSFSGDNITLSIAGTETPVDGQPFSMVGRDIANVIVGTIGYQIQLDSLRDGQSVSSVANGGTNTSLPTVNALEYDCTGANGMNYRLTFTVFDQASDAPGDYTDTLVLTAAPM